MVSPIYTGGPAIRSMLATVASRASSKTGSAASVEAIYGRL